LQTKQLQQEKKQHQQQAYYESNNDNDETSKSNKNIANINDEIELIKASIKTISNKPIAKSSDAQSISNRRKRNLTTSISFGCNENRSLAPPEQQQQTEFLLGRDRNEPGKFKLLSHTTSSFIVDNDKCYEKLIESLEGINDCLERKLSFSFSTNPPNSETSIRKTQATSPSDIDYSYNTIDRSKQKQNRLNLINSNHQSGASWQKRKHCLHRNSSRYFTQPIILASDKKSTLDCDISSKSSSICNQESINKSSADKRITNSKFQIVKDEINSESEQSENDNINSSQISNKYDENNQTKSPIIYYTLDELFLTSVSDKADNNNQLRNASAITTTSIRMLEQTKSEKEELKIMPENEPTGLLISPSKLASTKKLVPLSNILSKSSSTATGAINNEASPSATNTAAPVVSVVSGQITPYTTFSASQSTAGAASSSVNKTVRELFEDLQLDCDEQIERLDEAERKRKESQRKQKEILDELKSVWLKSPHSFNMKPSLNLVGRSESNMQLAYEDASKPISAALALAYKCASSCSCMRKKCCWLLLLNALDASRRKTSSLQNRVEHSKKCSTPPAAHIVSLCRLKKVKNEFKFTHSPLCRSNTVNYFKCVSSIASRRMSTVILTLVNYNPTKSTKKNEKQQDAYRCSMSASATSISRRQPELKLVKAFVTLSFNKILKIVLKKSFPENKHEKSIAQSDELLQVHFKLTNKLKSTHHANNINQQQSNELNKVDLASILTNGSNLQQQEKPQKQQPQQQRNFNLLDKFYEKYCNNSNLTKPPKSPPITYDGHSKSQQQSPTLSNKSMSPSPTAPMNQMAALNDCKLSSSITPSASAPSIDYKFSPSLTSTLLIRRKQKYGTNTSAIGNSEQSNQSKIENSDISVSPQSNQKVIFI
jgi:hypothetical protein